MLARIAGVLIALFGLSLALPLFIALIYDEPLLHFLIPFCLGLFLWLWLHYLPVKAQRLRRKHGFLIVALFWFLFALMGSLPFIWLLQLSWVDALFEAVSAITTTGATVITGLDILPKSILFYRQELQWLGGMGLIVLGLAILPLLGIGGMQLYQAEAPGPIKEKMTPRLADTARLLWLLYLGMTLICALAYWLSGMDGFDALAHSFSTVSTGGFSTHDASLAYFASPKIEAVAIIFMILASLNFGLHYRAVIKGRLDYWHDLESRTFLLILLGLIVFVGLVLKLEGHYPDLFISMENAAFEVVSVMTSTGFATVDFAHWPDFLPTLLIFISFIGGCGGSTAGGMKVMRIILLVKQGIREVRKLLHPNAALPIYLGRQIIDRRVMSSVWGFFAAYVMTFVVLMLLMIHSGLDQVSAFSAIATCMNNLGPGLGEVAYHFQSVSDQGKLIAVLAMLLGRLEIFTILILFLPEFWRD